jgi:Mrp family chromosome partitioning ATPase/predicted Fe-Mo cluster-binding NifX family protein
MVEKHGSCGMNHQKDQHDIQDAEIRDRLAHIKRKILVMSGKGGVGKSSVAAYLAVKLAKKGHHVGLMDVDLHGPSILRMLGLNGGIQPSNTSGKAGPVSFLPNLHVISIEALMGEDKDTATIWRGPLKIGVIRQFISDIEWSDLDYLIIDSPPGTGDEPLTIAQTIPDAEALIVTTPQEISLADVRKSISFCQTVNMRILGLVENMSGLSCPHCGKEIALFKDHGGAMLAEKSNLPLLASLPIEPEVVRLGDSGSLASLNDQNKSYTKEFGKMVDQITKAGNTGTQATSGDSQERSARADSMVFAVPTAEGKLCAHFGHCDQFALVETENGKIQGTSMHTPPPHEPGVLPNWLHQQGANVIIAGGMGAKAQQIFSENGIKVVTGAPVDSPESLVSQYLSDNLMTGDNLCDH